MTLSEFIKQFDTSMVGPGEHIAVTYRMPDGSRGVLSCTLGELELISRHWLTIPRPTFTRAYRLLANDELVELKKIQKPKPWQVAPWEAYDSLLTGDFSRCGFTHYVDHRGAVKERYGRATPWTAKDIWPDWEE